MDVACFRSIENCEFKNSSGQNSQPHDIPREMKIKNIIPTAVTLKTCAGRWPAGNIVGAFNTVYIYSHLQRRSNCSLYEKGNSRTEVERKPMVWWVPEPMRCVFVDSVPSVMDELLTAKPIRNFQTCQSRQSQVSASSANCGA